MVTSGFYNSVNGDRKYNAMQFSRLFEGIINDGVFANIGTSLVVTAGIGMTVSVGAGRAWFNNTWTDNDAPLALPVQPSELTLDRIDTVVLEVNTANNVRANTIKVIKGLPAASPVPPTLVDSGDLHQHPLAHISVTHNVDEILGTDITNLVGTPDCPFISGVLETITVEGITALLEAEFDEWFNYIKSQLGEAGAVGALQQQINNLDLAKADKSTTDSLQSQINTKASTSVTTDLQNQINTINTLNADIGKIFDLDSGKKYKARIDTDGPICVHKSARKYIPDDMWGWPIHGKYIVAIKKDLQQVYDINTMALLRSTSHPLSGYDNNVYPAACLDDKILAFRESGGWNALDMFNADTGAWKHLTAVVETSYTPIEYVGVRNGLAYTINNSLSGGISVFGYAVNDFSQVDARTVTPGSYSYGSQRIHRDARSHRLVCTNPASSNILFQNIDWSNGAISNTDTGVRPGYSWNPSILFDDWDNNLIWFTCRTAENACNLYRWNYSNNTLTTIRTGIPYRNLFYAGHIYGTSECVVLTDTPFCAVRMNLNNGSFGAATPTFIANTNDYNAPMFNGVSKEPYYIDKIAPLMTTWVHVPSMTLRDILFYQSAVDTSSTKRLYPMFAYNYISWGGFVRRTLSQGLPPMPAGNLPYGAKVGLFSPCLYFNETTDLYYQIFGFTEVS
jgi:hypothetical protein